ncbi:MAG: alanine/glycine:cation symporter family protein [Pseudomonadota bacterium]
MRFSGSAFSGSGFSNGAAGLPLIVVWLLTGAMFFTWRMRFINFRGFVQAIRIARGTYDDPSDPGEVTHFQALTAALSGTVGLGNIAGVAVAVSLGGPGATFWMILAGLLGMASKFTECTLGVFYRKINPQGIVAGGPMYYLRDGLAEKGYGGLGRFLAAFFAILCVGGAFGAGNMFQVNQSAEQVIATLVPLTGGADSVLAGKPWIIGLAYAFFVGLVIVGGIRSITKVTEKLVPLMAFVYLSGALTVIALNIGAVPSAFAQIVTGAFTSEGVVGGFIGVLVIGLRRATFSNEAGVGSAAIAHSAAKTREPVSEGLVALLEPFIDTVVICTITALVLIVTDMHTASAGLDGITLTSNAFASVISWFPYLLTGAVVLFAFSTSITWFYYGQRAFLYLCGDKPWADLTIKVLYLLTLIIGSSMTLGAVMSFADAMLLAMAFPNMIGLYILAPKVKAMLDSYLERVASGEIKPYKEQTSG